MSRHVRSRGVSQLHAIVARALEIWVIGNHYMAAHVADKPRRPLQHRSELIAQNAVWTANYLLSHFELCAPSAFWPSRPSEHQSRTSHAKASSRVPKAGSSRLEKVFI